MIPISLYVTVEIMKTMHAYFIINDSKLVSKLRRRQSIVNNFSIVDDLGMITHVFSDKTGTLTENEMKFKTCLIGNQIYGTGQRKKILQRNRIQKIRWKL